MKRWRYRLPVAVMILGFGIGMPLLGGRLLNAHAWGLPEAVYLLIILPIFVPPLSSLFGILSMELGKLANQSRAGSAMAQLNWNRVRLIYGILCWILITYLIGRYIDSRTNVREQKT